MGATVVTAADPARRNNTLTISCKSHPISVDISEDSFQPRQIPSIRDQRLTAKNPTMLACQRWQIDEAAGGEVSGALHRNSVGNSGALRKKWSSRTGADLSVNLSAAAARARASMMDQAPARISAAGAIHDPPTASTCVASHSTTLAIVRVGPSLLHCLLRDCPVREEGKL
jgi:hypothetical protein